MANLNARFFARLNDELRFANVERDRLSFVDIPGEDYLEYGLNSIKFGFDGTIEALQDIQAEFSPEDKAEELLNYLESRIEDNRKQYLRAIQERLFAVASEDKAKWDTYRRIAGWV